MKNNVTVLNCFWIDVIYNFNLKLFSLRQHNHNKTKTANRQLLCSSLETEDLTRVKRLSLR